MTEWKKVKLGDSGIEIIDGDRGKNYPSANEFFENGYCLFLNTKNVPHTCFDFSTCSFIDQQKDEKLRKGKLQFNDIVMTTRGTVGNFALYRSDCQFKNVRINSGMVIFRNQDERINTEFLNCLLSSNVVKRQIKELSSGSAQPQLPIRDINKIEIPLPSLEEQKRIAKILSSLDEKIENNNAINKNLEEQAQAIFKSWFMDFEPFGGTMPSDWREGTLGNVADITSSKRIFAEEYSNEGTPFYRGKEIIEKSKNSPISNPLFISNNKFEEIKNKFGVPVEGDILITAVGTLGAIYQVKNEEFYFKDGNLIWIRHPKVSSSFLFYLLKSDMFKQFVDSRRIGSTQQALTIDAIKKFTFLLPTKNNLSHLAHVFDIINHQIGNNIVENQKLSLLRDTLLPKLMSGEVRV